MYKWARLRTVSRNRTFYRMRIPFLVLFTIPVCRAVLVNRTIDSNFGDPVTGSMPTYQSPFELIWMDQTCSAEQCGVQPDVAKAFDGTWVTTNDLAPDRDVSVTLQFTGVAVWVFFILSNFSGNNFSDPGYRGTHVNITLDGQYAGNFSRNTDNRTDMIYNATIFSTSGLANTYHELVIGTSDYPHWNCLTFDWAIYTVDSPEASASQNTSSSTSVVFPSTTSSSSMGTMASTTPSPSPQSSSSKIGVIIVGSTLGGLVVTTLILVFLVRRLRRAPQVRLGNGNAEGILDIDVPPRHQPYYRREIPVSDHQPMQNKAARLRQSRQRELDERIRFAQHELDNLRSLRDARFADDIGDPSAAGPSPTSTPELALLRNEMPQQLRDQMDYLQAQREAESQTVRRVCPMNHFHRLTPDTEL
ncbi:hypothetical protein JOM56_003186 [Amanita muscaria]